MPPSDSGIECAEVGYEPTRAATVRAQWATGGAGLIGGRAGVFSWRLPWTQRTLLTELKDFRVRHGAGETARADV